MIYNLVMSFTNICFLIISLYCGSCKILELGSEFGDVEELNQPHLVMFYAPWCGHCKSLHPVWYELGNQLSRHSVTVARIDATIYRSAAEKFHVKGFPSIRLIGKDRVLEFVGDRNVETLTDFAIKGSRPLLESVGSTGKLNDLKRSDDVIYLAFNISGDTRNCLQLLAPTTVHETILAEVKSETILKVVSDAKISKVNDLTILRPDLSISKNPGIVVLKDSKVYEYNGSIEDCPELVDWIKSERFSAFQKGSYPVIHPLLFLKYKIVFYYGESKARVTEMEYLATQREALPQNFYFIHVDKTEYIENLISAFVEVDSILIFDPVTEFYSYSTDPIKSMKAIIEDVSEGKADLFGGTSLLANSKKVWYRIVSNVWPLFVDYPIVMGLIVCIPIALITFCCWDSHGNKEEPVRQVRSCESQMDLLWKDEANDKRNAITDDNGNESCLEETTMVKETGAADEAAVDTTEEAAEVVAKVEEEDIKEKDPELKKYE